MKKEKILEFYFNKYKIFNLKYQFKETTKRVLITGGAGFIGSALVRRLIKETNLNVYNLDKLAYSSDLTSIDKLLNKLEINSERYKFFHCDLYNKNNLLKVVEACDPDLVIHLAAESHVDRSIDNPENFIQSNIIGTFNLLDAVSKHWAKLEDRRKNDFIFHHVSTDEVYGSLGKKGKFSELTPYNPNSPYSASKASSDHLVNAWHATYKLPTVITNCSNNYGPWQFPEKLIPLVIFKGYKKESIPIYGNGLQIRDWLFIEDHIDAILLAATKSKPGEKYCIGGFGENNNKTVVETICDILDKNLERNFKHNKLIKYISDRPGHDLRYSIDSSKIQEDLGWSPKYNFNEGLEITVNWYLENINWIENLSKKSNYSFERLGISHQLKNY